MTPLIVTVQRLLATYLVHQLARDAAKRRRGQRPRSVRRDQVRRRSWCPACHLPPSTPGRPQMDRPSYLNFDRATYAWRPDIDYRANPALYRVGKGEQGVLICEPYKGELAPLWRF